MTKKNTAANILATPAAIAVQSPITSEVVQRGIKLIGTVGHQDLIKLTHSKDGTPICKFSVAVNDRETDLVVWHNIVLFDELAIETFENLLQGDSVKIVGTQRASSYTNKVGLAAIYVNINAYVCKVLAHKEVKAETKEVKAETVETEVVDDQASIDNIPF
jgi:single-stranded DNA-binding protein